MKRSRKYARSLKGRIVHREAVRRYGRSMKGKINQWSKNRKIGKRHFAMLKRHKELAAKSVKGKPMSLEEHKSKLYYASGAERPCWYCSCENNRTGSGLDRIDNNVTYTFTNTVPCCHGCNAWRGRIHSVKETRDHFKPMRQAEKTRRKNEK